MAGTGCTGVYLLEPVENRMLSKTLHVACFVLDALYML
jgi:hypothetical protein